MMEYLEEGWDYIVEGADYLFSGEWWGDIGEFFGGIFEDIGDFSIAGLFFGILTAGMIFLLRKQMLNSFLVHMGPMEAVLWGGLTYIGAFVGGYLVGKRLFDN